MSNLRKYMLFLLACAVLLGLALALIETTVMQLAGA